MKPLWERISGFIEHDLDSAKVTLLQRFRDWLVEEGVVAGGIGPNEADRVDTRHIADSLLFAAPWSSPPATIWDLGSGVGLPGIPLGILFPDTEVILIDKSGRRCDLARRATRVLGLENVLVLQRDFDDLQGRTDALVARAAATPEVVGRLAPRHVVRGGVSVVGGSWVDPPVVSGNWEKMRIPPDLLDREVWLLIMRH